MFHTTLLQRYMSGEKALKLIADGGFYFRRIDRYPDDPTEGNRESFGSREAQILNAINSMLPEKVRVSPEEARALTTKYMHDEKQNIFIQSWFSHQKMSRYMWDVYGGFSSSADCALITVNLHKLGKYLNDVLPIGYRTDSVKYVANKNIQTDGIFTKEEKFLPEKEYRVSINVGELVFFNPKILPNFDWPLRPREAPRPEDLAQHHRNKGIAQEDIFHYVNDDGFVLKAPLPGLVEAIYIPSTASENFNTKLDEVLAANGFAVKCERVKVPSPED